jgi:pyruvate formate lyase activating enzyme
VPDAIARAAVELGCKSVAFTYNDPVIFYEYAMDVAAACHARGVKTVAVTAGYMCPEPRAEFFSCIDVANVDLKAFTEDFYHRLTASRLAPVLDTLRYLKHETEVWLEITTLVIPGENDSVEEIDALTRWIAKELGPTSPCIFPPSTRITACWTIRRRPRRRSSAPARKGSPTACITSTSATATIRIARRRTAPSAAPP